MLPWKTYETFLVETKRKIDNIHEKTTVLKGATIVNYLHKDFKLIWMVQTLFTHKPTYSRITTFRITLDKLEEAPKSNVPLWRKCKEWMVEQEKGTLENQPAKDLDSNSDQQSPIIA